MRYTVVIGAPAAVSICEQIVAGAVRGTSVTPFQQITVDAAAPVLTK
jgi:hypothetical protein